MHARLLSGRCGPRPQGRSIASPHFEILLQRRSCPITSLQSLTWNLRFQLNATPPDTVGQAHSYPIGTEVVAPVTRPALYWPFFVPSIGASVASFSPVCLIMSARTIP